MELIVRPECARWGELVRRAPKGELFGHALSAWREQTRRELALTAGRPIIATGHQTLLWHPGILVKYMLTDAVAAVHGLATANLVVDQHADGFGDFEVPVRRNDGALGVRRIELTRPRPAVPMSRHEAFTPPHPPRHVAAALPSVAAGLERIHGAVYGHRDAPDAARQMAAALAELMAPWVKPMPDVTATDLVESSLARRLVRAMADDPAGCAAAYNAAVAAVPEAGIGPLLVRDDYVELPLWRLRDDGRRMRAYDSDAEAAVEDGAGAPRLLPRALFMTALVRLGMCDLFVHGLGGANYDRAMERWMAGWLGVDVAPIAVASADLSLPLLLDVDADAAADPRRAVAAARRAWHDPEWAAGAADAGEGPGPVKRELLGALEGAPYGSPRRRAAFFAMHGELRILRSTSAGAVERFQREAAEARRFADEAALAARRDWAFPLYPTEMIDRLAAEVRAVVAGAGCS